VHYAPTVRNTVSVPMAREWSPAVYSVFRLWIEIQDVMSYELRPEDAQRHTETVMYALNNAKPGQIVHWHNKQANTHGAVRVNTTYPLAFGYCSIYNQNIRIKDRDYNKTLKACKKWDKPWQFYEY
jgi:surface antigen